MTGAPTNRWWWTIVAAGVAIAAAGTAALFGGSSGAAATLAAGASGAVAAALVGVLRARQPGAPQSEERTLSGHLGYPCACVDPGRRRLLGGGALAAALAAVAAAAVPLWSATKRAEARLRRTSWQAGTRLVDDQDAPVRSHDLEPGAFRTVWPEGHRGDGDAQVVLIRLAPDRTVSGPGRPDWLAAGHVAYSKVCTHMGCPVGLYQARTDLLVCPCHQATFDVLAGASPVHGPAHRPLPQLPLAVDGDGYLIASGDFAEPVGPGYWSRPS
ncbi:MAG: Rieske (2Fe-2S) protein [Actinobacteria bacterium]|nr:Rieske (2Fe-2S) protein [Actinomycetota bacterium]